MLRQGQGLCLQTLKGCQSEEEEVNQGVEGRSRAATGPPRREGVSHLQGCASRHSLWRVKWGAAWGKVTLEVGLPFCAKPCAKCRVLRDVSDLVSTPREPPFGVCRPKPNNPRES